MNNRIIFGQYYEANSLLHRLDPRVKVIGLFFLSIALFVIQNLSVLLGFTTLLLFLIVLTKVPFSKFLKSIRSMSYIMIFTFIMQVLMVKGGEVYGNPDFHLTIINLIIIIGVLVLWFMVSKYIKVFKALVFIGVLISLFVLQYYLDGTYTITTYNILITTEGVSRASFLVIRIMDFLFISSLLTLTTKPTQINCALEKLLKPLNKIGVNVGAFSMIIAVTLRFIPTLLGEADKVLKAQASRGVDFKDSTLVQKVLQLTSLVIPLFVITYKKAVDLTDAMEARGYVDKKERSSIYELKYATYDYFSIGLIFILFAFSIASAFII